MRIVACLAVGVLMWAMPAHARDFCPDRPGISTPPCTLEPGRVSAEISFGDWTHDSSPDALTDTLIVGDLVLRYGFADHAELHVGWTAFGHVRSRDRTNGRIERRSGVGDLTLGVKRNLVDPTGKAFSVALLPSVTFSTKGSAIGAGDWSAGLQVPVNIPISPAVSFVLTPEIDAAADGDRNGRHLAYGTAGGLAFALGDAFNIAVETQLIRDEDPEQARTQAVVGLAAGLMLGSEVQIDVGSEFGLNEDASDARIYAGITKRF